MSGTAFLNELRRSSPLISVGVLTADLLSLGSKLALIEQAGVELVHMAALFLTAKTLLVMPSI